MNPSDEIDRQFRAYLDASDTDALRVAFERIAPELLRVGRAVGLDAASAEDALQETLLVVLRRREAFDQGRSLLPWATGIMRNMSRSVLRMQEDERRITAELRTNLGDETMNALERGAGRMEELERAIEGLPKGQRSVIRLRYVDGLRPLEIAERLELEPNTVSARLSRGLQTLRERVPPGLLGVALLVTVPRAARGLDLVLRDVERSRAGLRATRTAGRGLLVGTGAAVVLGTALLATRHPFESRAAKLPDIPAGTTSLETNDRVAAAALPTGRRASMPTTADEPAVPALAGRIRDENGAPADDVAVHALAQDFRLHLPGTPPAPVAHTDAEGRFRVNTSDCPTSEFGFYLVLARGAGGAAVTITEPDQPLDLVLEPTVAADVHVVDETGRPIEGARVAVVPAIDAFAGQNELGNHSIDGLAVLEHDVLFGGRTDALGNARIGGLPWDPDGFRVGAIGATADGYLEASAPIRWTSAGAVPRAELELVRIADARVRGRVIDTGGAPIPEGRVRARRWRDGALAEITVPVAADGTFTLPAPWTHLVPCALECSAPGYAPLQRNVDSDGLRTGAEPLAVTLTRLTTVRGRVIDARGEPVVGASIEHRSAGAVHVTRSSKDGAFTLDEVPSGPSVVTVATFGGTPEDLGKARVAQQFAAIRDPLEIVLERGTAAFDVALASGEASAPPAIGTTVLVRTGPGGTVEVHRPNELHGDRVSFRGIPLGPWTVYAAGHTPDGASVTASSRVDVTGAADTVRLDVAPRAEVEFEVADPSSDGTVHVVGRWGSTPLLPPWFAHADERGARFIDRVLAVPGRTPPQELAPGTWTFFGWREDGSVIRPFTREIAPGSAEHVRLELVPGGRVVVDVPGLTRPSVVEVEFRAEGDPVWLPVARFDVGRNRPTRRSVAVPLGDYRWRATVLGNALTGELERTHPCLEGAVEISADTPAKIDVGRGRTAR